MKKIMMMLALVLTVSTTFAFRNKEVINKQAVNAFRNEFASATDVAWTVGKSYYKVAFTWNDQKLFAYYNNQGEFIAISRFISSSRLPLALQISLKNLYRNYWISDLFEMATNDVTDYYVTFENADVKIILKSTDGSNWSLYQKSKKA
jgi:hypothetical protein